MLSRSVKARLVSRLEEIGNKGSDRGGADDREAAQVLDPPKLELTRNSLVNSSSAITH
jgi:hypothetical protein